MKKLLLLMFCFAMALAVSAQNYKTVKGQVLDTEGKPLADVTLMTSSGGTMNNADGSFDVTVAEDAKTLTARKDGYVSQELAIDGSYLVFKLASNIAAVANTSLGGGLKGQLVSRNGRTAVGNAVVTIEGTNFKAQTNDEGYFVLQGVPAGDYKLSFAAPEFENLDIVVKVENGVKDINTVIVVPKAISGEVLDDSIFAEFDNDSSTSDTQALPSSLAA